MSGDSPRKTQIEVRFSLLKKKNEIEKNTTFLIFHYIALFSRLSSVITRCLKCCIICILFNNLGWIRNLFSKIVFREQALKVIKLRY